MLKQLSCYIPETYIDLAASRDYYAMSAEEIKTFMKIYRLRYVPKVANMSLVELIIASILKLFKQSNINSKNIKYIIHTHTGKVVAPFNQSIVRQVKQQLDFKHAVAFGMSFDNCASIIAAMSLMTSLLKNPEDFGIVVAGDLTFTSFMRSIPNVSILGDASAAVLLQSSTKIPITYLKTEGRFAKGSWMESALGIEFEKKYTSLVAEAMESALSRAKLQLSDIKIILPHNVNYISWLVIAKLLKIPLEKIYLKNVCRYGHCFGADIIMNYESAIQDNLLNPGDYYLMVSVGLGVVIGVMVCQH